MEKTSKKQNKIVGSIDDRPLDIDINKSDDEFIADLLDQVNGKDSNKDSKTKKENNQ